LVVYKIKILAQALHLYKVIPKHYATMSRNDEYQTIQPRAVCSSVYNR